VRANASEPERRATVAKPDRTNPVFALSNILLGVLWVRLCLALG
jgi:hypothetical protein